MPATFDDLLDANRTFADSFTLAGFDGIAHAGVAVVTCIDSRIDPLRMLGLQHGDAKIFRNPGGRVTPQALEALVLGVHLLDVRRILVVPHTRCAMASASEAELRVRVGDSAGVDETLRLDSELVELVQAFDASSSQLRVTIRFDLIDVAQRAILLSETISASEPAARDPYSGVVAANAAVQRVLDQLVARLHQPVASLSSDP